MILVKALKRIIAYAYWTSNLTMCFKHTTNALDIQKVRGADARGSLRTPQPCGRSATARAPSAREAAASRRYVQE